MSDLKERAAILLFILTILAAIWVKSWSGVEVQFQDTSVDVEVVGDPRGITVGLMFREKLEKDKGMLFAYAYDDYHSIWMKNMNFPIDIIWLNRDLEVVDTAREVKPCVREPCPVYTPSKPARYVIEVVANFTIENGIKEGDNVTIRGTYLPGSPPWLAPFSSRGRLVW